MTSRAGRIKKSTTASPHHPRGPSSEARDVVNDVLMKERIRTVSVSRASISLPMFTLLAGGRGIHAKNKIRCAKES